MINDLKTGLKILRYGHGVKSTIICTILVLGLGVIVSVLDIIQPNDGINFSMGYFMMMASLFGTQLFYSVNVAELVQASPMKKRLQTTVPTALNVFTMLCGYLITVLTGSIKLAIAPESAGYACQQLAYSIMIMATIILYTAVAYKLFFLSTVMFFVIFFSTSQLMNNDSWLRRSFGGSVETFWLFAAAGLGILLICGVLHYLITLAVYKLPLSKRAQAGALRRQM